MRGPEADLKPSACSVSGTCAARQAKNKVPSGRARTRIGPLWLIFLFALRLDHHGRAAKSEALAKLVGQISFVREMQRTGAIGKEHEGGRTDGCLRDVVNLALFEMQRLHEAIQ